jgi:hypothetical protein
MTMATNPHADFTGSFTLPNGQKTETGHWVGLQYPDSKTGELKERFGLLMAIRRHPKTNVTGLVVYVGEQDAPIADRENPKNHRTFDEVKIVSFVDHGT